MLAYFAWLQTILILNFPISQVDDIVLLELAPEGGRRENVHYVGKLLGRSEDGKLFISYLRMKSSFNWNVFVFPDIADNDEVDPGCVLGVLTVVPSSSRRQTNTVTIYPGLQAFNLR